MIRAAFVRMWRSTGSVERAALALLLGVVGLGLFVGGWVDAGPSEARGLSLIAPLGRDHLGRNVAIRLLAGTRAAAVPFVWATLSILLGVVAAAGSSWRGGAPRALFGAVVDVLAAIPRFVWVLLALSIYGRSDLVLGVAAGLAWLPVVRAPLDARIARWDRDPGILAERAHGVPSSRLLWEHLVLWESGPLLVRQWLGLFGFVVALEATLAYLGFPVTDRSWGAVVAFDFGRSDVSWVSRLAPVLVVWITCGLALLASRSNHR